MEYFYFGLGFLWIAMITSLLVKDIKDIKRYGWKASWKLHLFDAVIILLNFRLIFNLIFRGHF